MLFQKSLHPCALDESSRSIGRVISRQRYWTYLNNIYMTNIKDKTNKFFFTVRFSLVRCSSVCRTEARWWRRRPECWVTTGQPAPELSCSLWLPYWPRGIEYIIQLASVLPIVWKCRTAFVCASDYDDRTQNDDWTKKWTCIKSTFKK